ncbi:deaminase [Clostridium saccharobutylicum]|uniref:CMP/dCMP deaminase, zinc-binding protein n=2 Tax=Clostridium saccharobutylicum TaxID=169679 RepID=U5ML60_CLOSA|nr:deaminase [Clostridium saccharobutylicum]AGX41529.1 CMP/dCMP deaminase, zinc-binding protein [Clostridium saccharobutylicum DSM 13864]AQR88809.1 cytidine and deoxycytidylate deaminase zinc-binding region [Clostridium saccharobutylicum]AQR98708.1 cytidine and deoxycytidylate deaminase zinc-binding region [Clostridium saccharobutylicum]AQS08430.1 cytidine and deoxycytidylate deaminase zinc-binding region [Clostridium saccharobutylicum]AQS12698.1 cytidine and deoxycytidylate deaminase zinc-bin
MERRDKHNYYLDIAETVLERGTCLRRNYGSIIVKNDEIISTGYTGAPRGRKNCIDLNTCIREKLQVPRGTHYELCRSVHSEANAIISASRRDMIGATLYLVGKDAKSKEYVRDANSCSMCKRLVINSGISNVIIRDSKEEFREIQVESWIEDDDSLQITKDFGY